HRLLALDQESALFKLDREGVLINRFKESMAQFVVGFVERADHAFAQISMNQSSRIHASPHYFDLSLSEFIRANPWQKTALPSPPRRALVEEGGQAFLAFRRHAQACDQVGVGRIDRVAVASPCNVPHQ